VDSVQWIPLDFDGVQWIPLDFGGVHWIPLESVGVRKVLPPSRASSEGGAGGRVGRTTATPSRISSEGGAGGCDGPGRVVVVESEVELQQVVKFNMHVTCHVIFGAKQELRKCEIT